MKAQIITVKRELLERVYTFIEESLEEIGGCDHSVGICCCNIIRLGDDVKHILDEDTDNEH